MTASDPTLPNPASSQKAAMASHWRESVSGRFANEAMAIEEMPSSSIVEQAVAVTGKRARIFLMRECCSRLSRLATESVSKVILVRQKNVSFNPKPLKSFLSQFRRVAYLGSIVNQVTPAVAPGNCPKIAKVTSAALAQASV